MVMACDLLYAYRKEPLIVRKPNDFCFTLIVHLHNYSVLMVVYEVFTNKSWQILHIAPMENKNQCIKIFLTADEWSHY